MSIELRPSLTYVGIIPAALTSLVVSRDVLLVYAGLYIRYMSVVPPVCQALTSLCKLK